MEIQTIFIWRLRLFLYGDSDYFYMEIQTIFKWRIRLFLYGDSDYFSGQSAPPDKKCIDCCWDQALACRVLECWHAGNRKLGMQE